MRAYLIDPSQQKISVIDIPSGESDLPGLIGQPSIGFDEIDDNGDRLYFDEACFINEKPGAGRFKLDNLPPVAGKAVVMGWKTAANQAADVIVGEQALAARVKFISG